jgi:hypothetical protein
VINFVYGVHIAKFFDLSPEDTEEVNQVKLSIFLNLAQCYLKLENYDNVSTIALLYISLKIKSLHNCHDVLY